MFTTQTVPALLAPRSRAMVGKAMLAMAPSRLISATPHNTQASTQ